MANNLARPGTQKSVPVIEAKAKVLDLIQQGFKVREACAAVGRSEETYRDWMKKDSEFKAAIQRLREIQGDERRTGRPEVPDFDVFCRDWLKQPLFPHQLRMWDVIEGREPRDLHPAMSYLPGNKNRVVINVPPHHAKTTSFSVNYVVWLIHKNPDIRVVLVSQGARLAHDFLYEIKQKLTSSLYREMHACFAPEGGWQDPTQQWTTDRIYVRGKNETAGMAVQKDPTVQAMGLKGRIYGRRADVVILDDIADSLNSGDIATQLRLINRDINSRLPSEDEGGGLLLVLGTRVTPVDIYRTLNDLHDADDRKVWTYLRQPAVLDYGEGGSSTWTTLWPEKWSGPALSRNRMDAGWNLFYQQLDIDDDMTFKAEAVNASINGGRFPGPMTKEGKYHREGGMDGLYMVGGFDPAASGFSAMVIVGLDRDTGKRWVLDGWNQQNASAGQVIAKLKWFTETYRLNEWVIEKNAVQRFITQIPEITNFMSARSCRITAHYTTANKRDSDWGIETMAPLFDSCVEHDPKRPNGVKRVPGMIELPSQRQNAWVNELVQQLTAWQPEGMAQHSKTDLVMALWFTHIACQKIMNRAQKRQTHMANPYLSANGRRAQQVISLAALREEKQRLRYQQEGIG